MWGPPGTGKTKTVSLMPSCLLKLKCRTLTCAPTNVAVLEVAKRVLVQVKKYYQPLGYGGYGLGDIVLFGNGKRMNIDGHVELHDVFLDYRVCALEKCLGAWKHSLASMISLLENPQKRFLQYLNKTNEDVSVDCHSQNKETRRTVQNLGHERNFAKLHEKGMAPIELLVIDEATQLKKCEAAIPLQLCGVRCSILIGDESQLPTMVQSKV
ncbi:hypothetical protein JHK82_017134 [Glycine max]|nr:hypothetical protein JHK87_017076 [Glycine soja]KAG5141439.1 hypothetical protein JHK82_017134 [Glycine max]